MPAAELAAAIAADSARAAEDHGVMSSGAPVFATTFAGVVGEGRSGVRDVEVEGLEGVRVRTGPAVNGTEVRDAAGTVESGQFTNRIECQNAGAALDDQVKAQVLSAVDAAALPGRTVEVTGVFRLVNPESRLVTPVRLGAGKSTLMKVLSGVIRPGSACWAGRRRSS